MKFKIEKSESISRLDVFGPPGTGGLGKTLYTMAAVGDIPGAGLLYRKKFGERRVNGSS